MAAQGRNEGFHVLDEVVCEAIHAPSISLADPTKQGRNEGMSVTEELLFDAGGEPTSEDAEDPHTKSPPRPSALDDVLKSEVERLAAFIAASVDPISTVAFVQRLLLDELTRIQRGAAGVIEQRGRTDTGGGKLAQAGTAPDWVDPK